MSKNTSAGAEQSTCRLDKWLWCARFYKTRSLAADAVKSGKVEVNAERVKPARLIAPGDKLRIRRGQYMHEISILARASARHSAALATTLYVESPESVKARELLTLQIAADRERYPRTRGRPEKRDRRALVRFKHIGGKTD